MDRLLVTGGAGFVGSALVRQLIAETDSTVINVDALTYAGSVESLGAARDDPRHVFERVDICDRRGLQRVFRDHRPDAVVHLAAETHVDRSIDGPTRFVETNVVGTSNLLETARAYWSGLEAAARQAFRFLEVSTDEVYGDLAVEAPPAAEDAPFAPSSPYAASKAAADHLVLAWHRTYAFPALVTHAANNYGPCQFPDKLIPRMIRCALADEPLPVYGDGANIRDWLHVEDHARALRRVLQAGVPGRRYNVAGRDSRANLALVREICEILDELAPRPRGAHADLVQLVADRPGHDRRYAVDDTRIRRELGWQPREDLAAALIGTVRWYVDRPAWLRRAAT